MKVIPIALDEHYQQRSVTTAYLLKVTRPDNQVFAYTSHGRDLPVDGQLYSSAQGLNISSIVQSAGFNVDNLELTTLNDGTVFTKADIYGGLWNNSEFSISRCNWKKPQDGSEPILAGTTGELEPVGGKLRMELRALQQYWQQPIGNVSTPTCRVRLGSPLCGIDLNLWTVTGTLTSVLTNQVFTDSARTEADQWFTEGELTFTSGDCAGLSQKVKMFASGQFILSLPMYQRVRVGDGYSVHAGCMHRRDEDCVAKFSNAANMQAEPDLPGVDRITSPP